MNRQHTLQQNKHSHARNDSRRPQQILQILTADITPRPMMPNIDTRQRHATSRQIRQITISATLVIDLRMSCRKIERRRCRRPRRQYGHANSQADRQPPPVVISPYASDAIMMRYATRQIRAIGQQRPPKAADAIALHYCSAAIEADAASQPASARLRHRD